LAIRKPKSSASLAPGLAGIYCGLPIDFQQISTKNIYWLPQIIPFTLQQGNRAILSYLRQAGFSLLFIF
jgi:hypothetical protein